MELLPKIKKEINDFILQEKGGASQQALISLGAIFVGIEALTLFSKIVAGATINVRHDHSDAGVGHYSVACNAAHRSGTAHSSADGVPSLHSSGAAHGSYANSGWGVHASTSTNTAHSNSVWLSYG